MILGEPFDPFLAALYQRCDGGLFGDLKLFGFGPGDDLDIIRSNQWARESWLKNEPWVARLFEYGKELGEPYYLATVPSLADPDGRQPVVCIAESIGPVVYPLASDVDKAFALWARYIEARLSQHGRLDEFMVGVVTPPVWRWIHLLAQDEELIRMLEAGTFDALIGDNPEVREWVKSVIQAARSR